MNKRNRSLQKERFPFTWPQPFANCPNCCTGNSFSWWLKVHLLNTAITEQVIKNHQLSLQKLLAYICNVCLGQRNHLVSIETMEPLLLALRRKKPGGEIRANHSILKLNRKSAQELSPQTIKHPFSFRADIRKRLATKEDEETPRLHHG